MSETKPKLRDLEGAALVAELQTRLRLAHEKIDRIGNKAFAVSLWFADQGIPKPEPWRDLFAEIVIADDQRLTEADIKRGQEIARKHGL